MEKGTFTDPRDGKTYKTVKIGKQTWLAENLNYDASGCKCYENNPANADKYGRLYNWETAKKACPPGWHLPNFLEWQELVNFAGGLVIAERKLKASSGWNYYNGMPGNGTDEFGFSALPGGDGSLEGDFGGAGNTGSWWSSTEYNASGACALDMHRDGSGIVIACYYKTYLYSVRCVQD